MWFNTDYNAQTFECLGDDGSEATYLNVVLKIMPIFILWEVNCIWGNSTICIKLLCKRSGIKNADMDEIEDIRNKNDLVSILQVQMLDFMEYYDFGDRCHGSFLMQLSIYVESFVACCNFHFGNFLVLR